MKLKLKEIYTREEAGLMSLISTLLKETPHTFQADSAYWDKVELDFVHNKTDDYIAIFINYKRTK